MPARIEDYALIGDCQTAALVTRDGSIDWLCFPRFDSGACFAALLGTPEHGRWQIAPSANVHRITRRYQEETLILISEVDGLPPGEGAFLICTFWLADNLALQGRYAEARALFVRLLALRNDVGLLSEEYDPHTRRLIGNFPQAFSHVGLINTATNLTQAVGPAADRQRQ